MWAARKKVFDDLIQIPAVIREAVDERFFLVRSSFNEKEKGEKLSSLGKILTFLHGNPMACLPLMPR